MTDVKLPQSPLPSPGHDLKLSPWGIMMNLKPGDVVSIKANGHKVLLKYDGLLGEVAHKIGAPNEIQTGLHNTIAIDLLEGGRVYVDENQYVKEKTETWKPQT